MALTTARCHEALGAMPGVEIHAKEAQPQEVQPTHPGANGPRQAFDRGRIYREKASGCRTRVHHAIQYLGKG